MYFIIKFLHIIAVIFWMGSFMMIGILNLLMERKKDVKGLQSLGKYSEFAGKFIIAPSATIALLTGVALSEMYGFGWNLWTIWGLTVIFFTGISGGIFIPKISKKLLHIAKEEPTDFKQLKRYGRRLTIFELINTIFLISAVWAMVYKPNF